MHSTMSYGPKHQSLLSEAGEPVEKMPKKEEPKKPSKPKTTEPTNVPDPSDKEAVDDVVADAESNEDALADGLEEYRMGVGVFVSSKMERMQQAVLDSEAEEHKNQIAIIADKVINDLLILDGVLPAPDVNLLNGGLEEIGQANKSSMNRLKAFISKIIDIIRDVASKVAGRITRARVRVSFRKSSLKIASDNSFSGSDFNLPDSIEFVTILGNTPKNPIEVANSINKALWYFNATHGEYDNFVGAMREALSSKDRGSAIVAINKFIRNLSNKLNAKPDPVYDNRPVFNQLPGGYKCVLGSGDAFSTNSVLLVRDINAKKGNLKTNKIPNKNSLESLLKTIEAALDATDERYKRKVGQLEQDFKRATNDAYTNAVRSSDGKVTDMVNTAITWFADHQGRIFNRALLLLMNSINAGLDYIAAAEKAPRQGQGTEALDSGMYNDTDVIGGLNNGSMIVKALGEEVKPISGSLVSLGAKALIISKAVQNDNGNLLPTSSVHNPAMYFSTGMEMLSEPGTPPGKILWTLMCEVERDINDIAFLRYHTTKHLVQDFFDYEKNYTTGKCAGNELPDEFAKMLVRSACDGLTVDTASNAINQMITGLQTALTTTTHELHEIEEMLDVDEVSPALFDRFAALKLYIPQERIHLTAGLGITTREVKLDDKTIEVQRMSKVSEYREAPGICYEGDFDELKRDVDRLMSLGDPLYAMSDSIYRCIVGIKRYCEIMNENFGTYEEDNESCRAIADVYKLISVGLIRLGYLSSLQAQLIAYLFAVETSLGNFIMRGIQVNNTGGDYE